MSFEEYATQPENAQCLTNLMYDMKLETGFDVDRLVEWVEDQAFEEGVFLEGMESSDECYEFFSKWYDELEYPESGAV
jgi:hypothetical protein